MRIRLLCLIGSLLAFSGSTCNPPDPIPQAELNLIREDVERKETFSIMAAEASHVSIAIVSHSTLDVKYVPFAIDNHQRYARKFGYDYIFRNGIVTERYLNPGAEKKVFKYGLYWQKIAAVQDALNSPADVSSPDKKRYQYVMWVDADALFTNFDKSIEDLIQKWGSRHEFFIAKEPVTKVNSGVFIVRNTPRARQMMEDIALTFVMYKNELLPEQQAIQDYLYGFIYYNPRGSVFVTPMQERNYEDQKLILEEAVIMPQREMNSFYKGCAWANGSEVVWEPGDFIAHFAVTFSERNKLLTDLLACFKARGGEDYENHQAKIQTCL